MSIFIYCSDFLEGQLLAACMDIIGASLKACETLQTDPTATISRRYPSVWLASESSLDWFPNEQSVFTDPQAVVANAALLTYLHGLVNGAGVALRLRLNPTESWRLAVAVKWEKELFFIFNDGETQSIALDKLIDVAMEFVCDKPSSASLPAANQVDTCGLGNVVILSHGFSPASGPGYRFMRSVETFIRGLGTWHVVVPDYRASYQFDDTRHGHIERIRQLFEVIVAAGPCNSETDVNSGADGGGSSDSERVAGGAAGGFDASDGGSSVLSRRQKRIVLIGHSQGGAVSCCAARQSVVRAANIVGLIALGSENPLSYDREFPRPPVRRLSFVHASGDRVVHPETMVQLGAAWRADTCVVLESRVRAAVMDCAGDDIAHGRQFMFYAGCFTMSYTTVYDCMQER